MLDKVHQELAAADEVLTDQPRSIGHLDLPDLEHREKHSIGLRFCLLTPAKRREIVQASTLRISGKTEVDLFTLDGGEIIAVSDKRLSSIPSGIDGLLITSSGGSRWQWHRRLESFQDAFRADPLAVAKGIENAWRDRFKFRSEIAGSDGKVAPGDEGLRPPQIGALHAIGAHWSVFANELATVVMPTGTGKTETMLSAAVNYRRGPTLVMVPSKALRNQTAKKFRSLGLLRKPLGLLEEDTPNPIVAVVTREPKSEADLSIFVGANVTIGVMASLGAASVEPLFPKIAEAVATLFVDEAHHVPADSWSAFRGAFKAHQVVQFTATPFRLDGKLVDGRVIFSYPLAAAQRDGYFKPIKFQSIFQIDKDDADEEMAIEGIAVLDADLKAGLNHLMMARCAGIPRGEKLVARYKRLAPGHNPILVHSDISQGLIDAALADLRAGRSRIVICVNMLGEGFDLPELKIAVLHDLHKSLPVLLQFTGRFTRTSASDIGDATVVANIADPQVSAKLERLYSESADWNKLLSEASSKAAREHAELVDFLTNSKPLVDEEEIEGLRISKNLLRPKFSTIVYRCTDFSPKTFQRGLSESVQVHAAWENEKESLVYFVTRKEDKVRWSRGKKLRDRQWDLFVLFHDKEAGLLHINSSDKDSVHSGLAEAVGAGKLIDKEDTFRSLGRINRLVFNNIGVRKHGRRNMSFAMYTGADVQQALTITEKAGTTKSNLDGRGWENGAVVAPGCSAKGRVWSKAQGTIPKWLQWCRPVGRKLIDETIDVTQILRNVLIPIEVTDRFPDETILSVEWPHETLKTTDERFFVSKRDDEQVPMAACEWHHDPEVSSPDRLAFRLVSAAGELNERVWLRLDAEKGYLFESDEKNLRMKCGREYRPLAEYLQDNPLMVRYVSLKELDGNLLYEQHDVTEVRIEEDRLVPWNWAGVDIKIESTWKAGVERTNSVQSHVAADYIDNGFHVVFNDDDAGEAADLVCLREEEDHILLALVHCKYSGAASAGERVKDVVEVASQAVRSAVWRGNFDRLYRHMMTRLTINGNGSASRDRFVHGTIGRLNAIAKSAKMKPIVLEISIVQPGVSRQRVTDDQAIVLGAAAAYIKQTVDVDLRVICSD